MKTMRYVKLWVLWSILALGLIPAQAAIVSNLYQGEVTVTGQTPDDWKKALPLALKQVLIKLTGNQQIDQIEAVRNAMAKAQNYVQSYNYLTLAAADPSAPATTDIQIRFSPKSINRILMQAYQPILPNNRPATLVWLVIPDANNQPQLVADANNSVVNAWQKQAEIRGLPLIWPKLDPQDLGNLSAAQAWSLNTNQLKLASDRYHPEKILVAKLQKVANVWQANWLMIDGANTKNAQTQGPDLNQIIAAGVIFLNAEATSSATATAVPAVAANPATPAPAGQPQVAVPGSIDSAATTPSASITLKVDGIHGLDDYAALLNYLRGLSSVATVDTQEMNDDNIVLVIQVNGSSDMLAKDITAGGKLQPNKEAIDPEVWDYHWNGTPATVSPETTPDTSAQPTAAPVADAPAPAMSTTPLPATSPAVPQPPAMATPSSGPVYTTPPAPAESYPLNDQPQSFKSASDDESAE